MCNKNGKILVVGDVMLDIYSFGDVTRISPEAPVPVLRAQLDKIKLLPGGATNVVMNLIAAGVSEVAVFAVIGSDEQGRKLTSILNDAGVDTSYICVHPIRPTTVKHRFIAQNNQQIMRIDYEDSSSISLSLLSDCIQKLEKNIEEYELVVLSDYDKGLLNRDVSQKIIELANKYDIPVLADVKGVHVDRYKGATLLKPNKDEVKTLTGMSVKTIEDIIQASMKLCRLSECQYVLTTLGSEGMILVTLDKVILKIDSIAREVYDVTGAGDTAIAYLAAMLVEGKDIFEAVRIANYAAGVQVSKVGTSIVYPDEIKDMVYGCNAGLSCKEQFFYKENGMESIRKAKKDGQKVVFTNGCFDILHVGHIEYLRKARAMGDLLVVGINSDASVRRIKGDARPVNTLKDRMVLLAALEFVDYVVAFEEDTPELLIKYIMPDILVKGSEYSTENIVGYDFVTSYGGNVITVPMVEGKSTTSIIKKITNKEMHI